ncbi:hypothetical protein DE146DRAFT_779811 [Phaeosphaeria sp. MPI-PUGE-AT-0046c]|nr:hypothetical protein DE146DRAFT_779811 [Phaeosphaeria sp. MPI-PUGE-AT-0046c]
MAHLYPEFLLYALLLCISMALACFSRSIPYTTPTTDDKFLILDANIDYLNALNLRLDHMLEIIYFGFMIAFFFLAFCYGRMQRKIMKLEAEVAEGLTSIEGLKAAGFNDMLKFDPPAYGHVVRELANEASLRMVFRDLVRLETGCGVNVLRIKALEKEIKKVQGEKDDDEKIALPA